MFGHSDGGWPVLPAEWRPCPAAEPRPHQYGPDGTCSRPWCGVHFLDATGPCPERPRDAHDPR